MKKIYLFAFIILTTALLIAVLSPLVSGQAITPQLRLHRGTFDAQAATPTANPQAPGLASLAPGPYAIIQFRGPISVADRAALERTGVTIFWLPVVIGATSMDMAPMLLVPLPVLVPNRGPILRPAITPTLLPGLHRRPALWFKALKLMPMGK